MAGRFKKCEVTEKYFGLFRSNTQPSQGCAVPKVVSSIHSFTLRSVNEYTEGHLKISPLRCVQVLSATFSVLGKSNIDLQEELWVLARLSLSNKFSLDDIYPCLKFSKV